MTVGFTVGLYSYQVGTDDFLYAFFSTIAYRLERGYWGTNYPVIMKFMQYDCMLEHNGGRDCYV